MKLHLLIDGYNLIRNHTPLARAEARDFSQGRQALLTWLAEYRKTAFHPITVVFDGGKGESPVEERDLFRGIKILYSRAGETADEVIKKMAARERGRFLVITSDRELARSCRSYGAEVVRSEAFARKVEERRFGGGDADEEEEDSVRRKKKKGASFRLSKKAKRDRRIWEKL